jgi:acetylornithine deacetylase
MTAFSPAFVQAILGEIEQHRDRIIKFARELFAIPSENHPPSGDEREAQELVAASLRRLDMEVDMFCPDEIVGLEDHAAYAPFGSGGPPVRDYMDRPNVVGTLKGSGGGRSLILTSHVDTVPVGDLSKWTHNPWSADLEGDKIFARGAIDDKGSLAASIMALASLQEIGVRLRGDLVLESFVDEEFGGGNGALATILRGYRADAAIMGEPTNFAICPQTYGCQSVRIRVPGRSAHAFEQWKAVNAVEMGLLTFQRLEKLREERCERARQVEMARQVPVPLPLVVRGFRTSTSEGASIPDRGDLEVWLATMPVETRATLEMELSTALTEVAGDPRYRADSPPQFEFLGRYIEPTFTPADHPIVQQLQAAYERATGERGRCEIGPAGDTYMYTNYGHMPTVMFGPGEIYRAHAPDEYVTVDELVLATKVLALLIAAWCGIA